MKLRLLSVALLAATAPQAYAAGTAAGTSISNTASASFTDPGGTPRTATSNTELVQVDEILDVTVDRNDAGNVAVLTPAADQVLSFRVKNTGNGDEQYALSVQTNLTGDDFDPASVQLWLDDGDGVFEPGPGGDTLLDGSNDPVLGAEDTITVFVVSDIPGGLTDGDLGQVRLVAEAVTAQANAGVEAAGYTFAGQGAAGSDAVVGATQAYATFTHGYVAQQSTAAFVKSSSIDDGFGGSNAIPGAVITYSLALTFSGSGTITGAAITDAIPAGTTYEPGSLKLGGATLTDAADADAGTYTAGTGIAVTLGDVTAPATRTVTFKVKIN
jgi:uncharacterized repeat protein (TIGR01451 family)